MILSTTFDVNGKVPKKTLGLVKGNTIRARWFGRDIAAGFKQIVGGEIKSYTDMISLAREEATERMIKKAEELKADAIIGVRYTTAEVMKGAAEVLVYGTAVKL